MTSDNGAPSTPSRAAQTEGDEQRWSRDSIGPPSVAVVTTIAQVDGRDPTELPPLFDAIDPDALDATFPADASGGASRVSFRYCDYEVDVRPSVVRVRAVDRADRQAPE